MSDNDDQEVVNAREFILLEEELIDNVHGGRLHTLFVQNEVT